MKTQNLEHLRWYFLDLNDGSSGWYVYMKDKNIFFENNRTVYWNEISKVITK